MAAKAVVAGIDLGACDSYVAYVGKGIVDIVQNEVSKRATSTVVGFTDRERLLGDAALAQIRSNAKNTCRNFKHFLGRKVDAADFQIEHFWSTANIVECADGFAGYEVMYKGEQRKMSAVEVTAMYFTKLRDITEKWCEGPLTDVVISVPSAYSDIQRQALLDAAKIANLNVLRLMNEHTATALAYGIYRSNDFDPEVPMTVAFCSMGISIFSVSIVRFVRGKLTVVCERSDKVGGRELDECLMRVFAAQFKKKHGCDPLTSKKAAFKLEDAVLKTKKVLSANSEAPITCECLMEDQDFASTITRADLEAMCAPAMERVRRVLEDAKAASGIPVDKIDSVEIVGGGSRVPWVKQVCSEAFGGKAISTTMNQEESVARGCALQAAILSPLYKVRDFKVEDASSHAVLIRWMGSSADAEARKGDEDFDAAMAGGDGEHKTAVIFPEGSQMNVLKMLTFYRKAHFDISAEFANPAKLLPGTPKHLGTFRIELPTQTEPKKVKVRAKLDLNGCFSIEGAQMVEEEDYEETVKEKREVAPGSPDQPEGAEAKQEAEGKAEWVEVKRMKKRTKKTDLHVSASSVPGLGAEQMRRLIDAEAAMQADMRDIIETDEKRNDLESYIFNMRDKISQSGEYGEFVSDAERAAFSDALTKAEDWLYDNMESPKTAFVDKLAELKVLGDPIVWRSKEDGMRAEWIQAVKGTIVNYRTAAQNPGDKFGHIAPEKLGRIVAACAELEQWLTSMQAQQSSLSKHDKPVLLCAEMESRNHELAQMADGILREPRPGKDKREAPPADDKKDKDGNDVD
mmetsp:Transcript_45689/g.133022  ORF Transcript_45689/g.133022 Transcript_45689/m.133022 type:complete len:800 (+) Transcript_45689:83-2482(+)